MEKIKNFFRKLFSRNKQLKLEPKSEDIHVEAKDNKDNIKESLRIDKRRLELIELQRKFEKNELDLYSLTKKQIQDLTALYEEQVKELNYKLGTIRNSES